MTVSDISDETLMALADDELPAAEAAALRARIDNDPDLAERFALFAETGALLDGSTPAMTAADERLAAAVRAMAGEPAPAATRPTLTAIAGGKAAQSPAPAARPAAPPVWRLPLAASVALVVGAVGGYLAAPQTGPQVAAIPYDPALSADLAGALSQAASGTAVTVPAAGGATATVTLISTHRVADGSLCREYRVVVGAPQPRAVVAASCRGQAGWSNVLAIAQPAGTDGTFAPASGATEAADQYLASLGSRGALSTAEEAAALRR